MDYVTRQFINLTKKFRKELPKLAESIRQSLKQHTSSVNAAQKSSEQQKDVQPPWLEPLIAKYQEPVRNKQTSDNRHYSVQNSMRWAAWATFAAAAFYGGVAALQWWDFNRSLGINQIIARQSRIQAAAALVSVQQNKNSFELDERAWVGIDLQLKHTINPDGAIHFMVNGALRNTGKTPALKMNLPHVIIITRPWNQIIDQDKEWDAGIKSIKHMEKTGKMAMESKENQKAGGPQFISTLGAGLANLREKWYSEGSVLAPNSPPLMTLAMDDTVTDPSLKNGQPQVTYWIGRLTYFDIFSPKKHTTKFCLWYAENAFELCPTGNSMD